MLANKEKVQSIQNYLDQKGVYCLTCSSYNDEEAYEKNPFYNQYHDLFEALVSKIYKHFQINSEYEPIVFTCFYSDEGVWHGSFLEPDCDFTIEKILNDDYSELKYIKEEIKKDKLGGGLSYAKSNEDIENIINFLDRKGVTYLDYFAFNEVEDNSEYVNLYRKQYLNLRDTVVNKIYSYFDINPDYDDVSFEYFGHDNSNKSWYGAFDKPKLYFDIDKVLEGDYSQLEELKKYRANDIVNPVDIDAYAKAVNDYNALPIEKRKSWLELSSTHKKPFDNPVLYRYNSGDDEREFVLQAIPEWASERTQISDSKTANEITAIDYYLKEKLPDDLLRQDLKLVVVGYNYSLGYHQTIPYIVFLRSVAHMKAEKFPQLNVDVKDY